MSGAGSAGEEETPLVRGSDDLGEADYRPALSSLLERELAALEWSSAAEERDRRAQALGLLEDLLPEDLA